MFGLVASNPTVLQLVETLAGVGPRASAAIQRARAEVRKYVWTLAGADATDADGQVVVAMYGLAAFALLPP